MSPCLPPAGPALPGAAAGAERERPPELTGIRVGFAGYYKAGLWTPVEIRLRGGSRDLAGRVSVTVADSDGTPCRTTTPEQACQVRPGQETAVTLMVRFGHRSSSLEAGFEVAGQAVAARTFQTAAEPDGEHFREALQAQRLLVQLGDQSLGLEEAAGLVKVEGRPAAVVARLADAGQLPDRWAGYEAVDTVVLATSRPGVWRKLSGAPARLEALDRWVRLGGRLVLSAGSRAGEVFAPESPLARFAPGRFAGLVPLHQTGALETFARSTSPIPSPAGGPAGLAVARLAAVEGRVEAAEADLPLVIRTPRGFGQVIFLAADLDQPPLAQWSDRKLLAARLLDLPAAEPPLEDVAPGAAYGYSDLAGQLRSALDQFPGVRRVPFFVVALLALAYLLLIGPGDYFFLRSFARRMEWTWATFPAIVVLFAVGAYVAAYCLKGDRLRIRQVDLIDVDTDGSQRGTTWLGLFSPRMETFELAVRPRPAEGEPTAGMASTTKLALEPLRPDGRAALGADATIGWLGWPARAWGGCIGGSWAVWRPCRGPAPTRSRRRWTRSAACRFPSGRRRVLSPAGSPPVRPRASRRASWPKTAFPPGRSATSWLFRWKGASWPTTAGPTTWGRSPWASRSRSARPPGGSPWKPCWPAAPRTSTNGTNCCRRRPHLTTPPARTPRTSCRR